MNKLNTEYFRTRNTHRLLREKEKRRVYSFKERLIMVLIGIFIICSVIILQNHLLNRIEQNELERMELKK
ncbi:hypothetical protein [Wenyingzhuangia sp. IMCC45574]